MVSLRAIAIGVLISSVGASGQDRAEEIRAELRQLSDWESGIELQLRQRKQELADVEAEIDGIEPHVTELDAHIEKLARIHGQFVGLKTSERGLWQSFCDGYNEKGGKGNVLFGFWNWNDKQDEDRAKTQEVRERWNRTLEEINNALRTRGLTGNPESPAPLKFADLQEAIRTFAPQKERLETTLKPEQTRLAASIARLEEELATFREKRRMLGIELRGIESVQQRTPEPVAAGTQPILVARIVEPTPSGPIDSAPHRRCAWRFYIELEEQAGRGVELQLSGIAVEPARQDADVDRYHSPPTHRYAWKSREIDHVGGWIEKATGEWKHGDDLRTTFPPQDTYAPVPQRLLIGPYYLLTWEDEGFAGKFEAVFNATLRDGSRATAIATFVPPPPPWTAATALRVESPDADELVRPASCPEPGFAGHDQYHLQFGVLAQDLSPGLYRLELAFEPGPTRYIWKRIREGETTARFGCRIPIPTGRFSVTLRVPEAPQVAPVTLNGRCDPARGTLDALQKAVARYQQGRFASEWQRGDGLLDVAEHQNYAGQWIEALQTATQAEALLPLYVPGNTIQGGVGSNGREYRPRAVKAKALALYHLGDAEGFLKSVQWLCQEEVRLAQATNTKSYYRDAAWIAFFGAERLLRMGVHPDRVSPLIEQGRTLAAQGGPRQPPKVTGFPE